MRTLLRAVVLAALPAILAAPASSATVPSGTAVAVIQASEANGITGRRTLAPAAAVYTGDRITTGNIGEAQLRFRDGTKLVVGPNSSMVLDAFVFNDDDSARDVSINAVRGAFRFITGTGPKDAYAITTPTATISVRGTAFDLSVDAQGNTRTAVVEGGVLTCDRLPPPRQTCVFQTANCDVTVTEIGRIPRYPVSSEERRRDLLLYFPYFRSQRTLLTDYQLDVDGCGVANDSMQAAAATADVEITKVASLPPVVVPPNPPGPPDPPGESGNHCGGNCGVGAGNGGGNGTGNEGHGHSDDKPGNGPPPGKGKD